MADQFIRSIDRVASGEKLGSDGDFTASLQILM